MEMADEIMKELWKIKDSIAEEYGCDVKALAAHLRMKKHGRDQQIIDLRGRKRSAEQDAEAELQQRGTL